MSDRDELIFINNTLEDRFRAVNQVVLEDERFLTFPAALKNHHTFEGGLLRHTLEVVRFCSFLARQNPKINEQILLTAAIWHDFGKVYDIQRGANGRFYEHSHKRKIYHICRSYAEFFRVVKNFPPNFLSEEEFLEIQHCILSHHNLPEWQSPRLPQTTNAWALHISDLSSAFCCDARSIIDR